MKMDTSLLYENVYKTKFTKMLVSSLTVALLWCHQLSFAAAKPPTIGKGGKGIAVGSAGVVIGGSQIGGGAQSAANEYRLLMQDRAILHLNLMNTIGLCRDPRPLIVYPPASNKKIYYPRGTLVHRCTDQTGCCPNPGEVCRPETVEEIEKVFFVNHLVINGQKVSGHRITPRLKAPKQNFTTLTESLTFTNHTACKCVKLAPNSIEHDDLQSVVSRPLVTPTASFTVSNNFVYHMVTGATLIALVMVIIFLYKFFYIRRHIPAVGLPLGQAME